MTNEWNFAYLLHFITLDMGILPPSTELHVPYQKLLYYDGPCLGIIRLKRRI